MVHFELDHENDLNKLFETAAHKCFFGRTPQEHLNFDSHLAQYIPSALGVVLGVGIFDEQAKENKVFKFDNTLRQIVKKNKETPQVWIISLTACVYIFKKLKIPKV